VLTAHGVQIAPSSYYAANATTASVRAVRDALLLTEIERVFHHRDLGRGLAGARKVWHLLRREGVEEQLGPIARCTVERLMRSAGLARSAAAAGLSPRVGTPRRPGRRIE
jgi:putative transposase